MPVKTFKSIKNWADDDKPREKLIAHGRAVLSDAELLAILISTGSRDKSAIDLARELMENMNGSLSNLARCDIKTMCQINGIGPAKAVTIAAALELGNRRNIGEPIEMPVLTESRAVYELMKGHLQDEHFEQFWILTLNRKNQLINKHKISDGGVTGTVADPKRIFKAAIGDLASALILLHNHPSGSLIPSQQDKSLTKKIKTAGTYLDISVLDHLIITSSSYFSFADESLMREL